jgi:hypothetical protein
LHHAASVRNQFCWATRPCHYTFTHQTMPCPYTHRAVHTWSFERRIKLN